LSFVVHVSWYVEPLALPNRLDANVVVKGAYGTENVHTKVEGADDGEESFHALRMCQR